MSIYKLKVSKVITKKAILNAGKKDPGKIYTNLSIGPIVTQVHETGVKSNMNDFLVFLTLEYNLNNDTLYLRSMEGGHCKYCQNHTFISKWDFESKIQASITYNMEQKGMTEQEAKENAAYVCSKCGTKMRNYNAYIEAYPNGFLEGEEQRVDNMKAIREGLDSTGFELTPEMIVQTKLRVLDGTAQEVEEQKKNLCSIINGFIKGYRSYTPSDKTKEVVTRHPEGGETSYLERPSSSASNVPLKDVTTSQTVEDKQNEQLDMTNVDD